MALFGMKIKSRHGARTGLFHVEGLNDRTALRQRKQMGYLRSIFTAISLLFGGGMIYVAMHYIPAFVQPQKVVKFATGNTSGADTYDFDRDSKVHKVFGPYLQLFHLDRAYLKAGQKIEFKYDLPNGAYAETNIIQCQRIWVIEVFNCRVTGRYNSKTDRRSGVQSFAFKDDGFYYFKDRVVGVPDGEPYRISWERGQ